jgi:hypothetical protein
VTRTRWRPGWLDWLGKVGCIGREKCDKGAPSSGAGHDRNGHVGSQAPPSQQAKTGCIKSGEGVSKEERIFGVYIPTSLNLLIYQWHRQ